MSKKSKFDKLIYSELGYIHYQAEMLKNINQYLLQIFKTNIGSLGINEYKLVPLWVEDYYGVMVKRLPLDEMERINGQIGDIKFYILEFYFGNQLHPTVFLFFKMFDGLLPVGFKEYDIEIKANDGRPFELFAGMKHSEHAKINMINMLLEKHLKIICDRPKGLFKASIKAVSGNEHEALYDWHRANNPLCSGHMSYNPEQFNMNIGAKEYIKSDPELKKMFGDMFNED